MKKYYKTINYLIIYNPEFNTYKICNHTLHIQKILTEDEFKSLNPVQIKKRFFSELMNKYFRNVKDSWIYQGVEYKKLDNFEHNRINICSNYDFNKLPKHNIGVLKNFIIVYHWGKIYYFLYSYNGEKRGQLFDIKTNKLVKWTSSKNCAPIYNVTYKHII